MKMVIAVIHDEDAHELMESLTKSDFGVTKLASTGGFLKSGNTTLFVGVEKEKVQEVLDIITEKCKCRKEITTTSSIMGDAGGYVTLPIEISVGGATVFVLDVEDYLKI
ncbi:MAG: cyclic-di-AMP receptor [Acidaminobacteraceae bacterium]